MAFSRFMCRRVMAALGRTYFFCMGFRVVVKGRQVTSSEAPILAVAPHSTFYDGIVCIVAGLPSTVSRVENLATPIFGSKMPPAGSLAGAFTLFQQEVTQCGRKIT